MCDLTQSHLFTSAFGITEANASAQPAAALADPIRRILKLANRAGASTGPSIDLTVYLKDAGLWATQLRPVLTELLGSPDFRLSEVVVDRLSAPNHIAAVTAHVALPPASDRLKIDRVGDTPASPTRTEAVVVAGGRLLLTAGQVANGPDGSIVGSGDLARQTAGAYANVGDVLASSGADPSTVLTETVWTVDLRRWLPAGQKARADFYGATFPATTAVQIGALSSPEQLVEIEIVAAAA